MAVAPLPVVQGIVGEMFMVRGEEIRRRGAGRQSETGTETGTESGSETGNEDESDGRAAGAGCVPETTGIATRTKECLGGVSMTTLPPAPLPHGALGGWGMTSGRAAGQRTHHGRETAGGGTWISSPRAAGGTIAVATREERGAQGEEKWTPERGAEGSGSPKVP